MSTISKGLSPKKELKSLLYLAGPVVASQLAQMSMGFVDTLMAGRVSAVDLAGVAMGASIWGPVLMSLCALLLALPPSIAQFVGARRKAQITPLLQQSIWLLPLILLLSYGALALAKPLLTALGVDAAIIRVSVGYLTGVAVGVPAFLGFVWLRCMSEGLARTRPVMWISFAGLAINIPANYIFIYGKLGLPALGGAGCGWGTAVTFWLMFLTFLFYILKSSSYRVLAPFWYSLIRSRSVELWHKAVLIQLIKLGLPISAAVFVETSIFSIVGLLLGVLGADMVAANQIALNFSALMFMVPMSLATAITVRVGWAIGLREPERVNLIVNLGLLLALLFAACSASVMLLLPQTIVAIYTDDPSVRVIAAGLLYWAALFQFSDGLQVAAVGALRGFKDTRVAMMITIIAYWLVALPVGYTLALTDFLGPARGARGFWMGLVLGLTLAAVFLLGCLYRVRQAFFVKVRLAKC